MNLWKLKDSPSVSETLGPVRNFMMRYTLERSTYTVETRAGAAIQNRTQLQGFELIPLEETGETLEIALSPNSATD